MAPLLITHMQQWSTWKQSLVIIPFSGHCNHHGPQILHTQTSSYGDFWRTAWWTVHHRRNWEYFRSNSPSSVPQHALPLARSWWSFTAPLIMFLSKVDFVQKCVTFGPLCKLASILLLIHPVPFMELTHYCPFNKEWSASKPIFICTPKGYTFL